MCSLPSAKGKQLVSTSRVTMKDIAAKLGVSVNTVHKAVTGKPGVSEALRAKITETAESMGYRRNESASNLRRKDLRVAVCLPSATKEGVYFFSYLWKGCTRYAHEQRDHGLVFEMLPYELGGYAKTLETLVARLETGEQLDGMIAYNPISDEECSALERIIGYGVKVQLIDGDKPQTGRFGAAIANYEAAGNLMAEQAVNLLGGAGSAANILLMTGDAYTDSHYQVARAFHAYIGEHAPALKIEDLPGAHAEVDRLRSELNGRLGSDDRPQLVCSVFAVGSEVMADVIVEQDLVGKIRAIGNDIFPESAEALRRGIFTNIVYKDPVGIAYRASKRLGDNLLWGIVPKNDVCRGPVELVFASNLDQYCKRSELEAISLK